MSVSCIVRAFIRTGGRIMLNPGGQIVASGEFAGLTSDDPQERRRSHTICRRFYRRLRSPAFKQSLRSYVIDEGRPEAGGWIVVEGSG